MDREGDVSGPAANGEPGNRRQQDTNRRERQQRERVEAAERQQRVRAWHLSTVARYDALISMVTTLCDEIRELTKKRPEDLVTQYYVDRANRAVNAVKSLLREERATVAAGDEFTEDLVEDVRVAVPAGDQLQRQDLLLIMSETKAALVRLAHRHRDEWRSLIGVYR